MKGIKGQVLSYIADNLLMGTSALELREDTSFLDHGIIDSTGVIELISFLEETFGIQVEDQEIIPENLDSLRRVEHYVMRKLAAQNVRSLTA